MTTLLSRSFTQPKIRSTTVIAVKKGKELVIIADGQVTQGNVIIKENAHKLRQLRPGVICGFAGSLADAFTILDELEKFMDKYQNFSLLKPCIELAIKWRTEGAYKRLEASVLVGDADTLIELDGEGNVLVHDRFRAIGSGGIYAECKISRRGRGAVRLRAVQRGGGGAAQHENCG